MEDKFLEVLFLVIITIFLILLTTIGIIMLVI